MAYYRVKSDKVCYERNQLAQAHQLWVRATEVDPNPTNSGIRIRLAVRRALIQMAEGNGDAAQDTLQAALELNTKQPSAWLLNQDLIVYQALGWVRQGDYAKAESLIREIANEGNHALSLLVRSEILMNERQYTTAENILTTLIKRYPQGIHPESIMPARVLLALALFEQHKLNQACQMMADAVRLAGPETFIRPFLNQGSNIVPLLALVLDTENLTTETRSFIKEILRILGHTSGKEMLLPKKQLLNLSAAASITPREQQVLQFLSIGLSNHEIAERCSVSETTIKTHLVAIYRKLGVRNRVQAVAQAKTLKLIGQEEHR